MNFYNCGTAPSIPHNVIIIVVAPRWTAAANPARVRSSPLAAFPGHRPRMRHKRLLAQGKIIRIPWERSVTNGEAQAESLRHVVCSLAIQNGIPLETIRRALLRDSRGRANTPLGCALDLIAEGAQP